MTLPHNVGKHIPDVCTKLGDISLYTKVSVTYATLLVAMHMQLHHLECLWFTTFVPRPCIGI